MKRQSMLDEFEDEQYMQDLMFVKSDEYEELMALDKLLNEQLDREFESRKAKIYESREISEIDKPGAEPGSHILIGTNSEGD